MKASSVASGFLENCIDQALAREDADVVIKNTRFLNLVTGELVPGDIAICGDRIVGTYESYNGKREIDGKGLIAVPGFIDTHVHCESTLVTPAQFDQCVLPRGTTTAICDPHEICNVLGTGRAAIFRGQCFRHGHGSAGAAFLLRAGHHAWKPPALNCWQPTCCPFAPTPKCLAWQSS